MAHEILFDIYEWIVICRVEYISLAAGNAHNFSTALTI